MIEFSQTLVAILLGATCIWITFTAFQMLAECLCPADDNDDEKDR